jgi:uncharacterized protein (DUF983 family)
LLGGGVGDGVGDLGLDPVVLQHHSGEVTRAVRVERAAMQQPSADGDAGAHIGKTKDETTQCSTHVVSLADEDCIVSRVMPMPSRDPSFARMTRRAIVLRCPWCGSRRTFIRGWLGKHDRCRTCGLRWRREEGFELGAVTVNTVLTFIVLTAAMTVGFVLTSPDIPVAPMVLSLIGVAVLMPIVIYPFTFTIWLAFDLAVHRPEAAELAEAAAAVETTAPVHSTPR